MFADVVAPAIEQAFWATCPLCRKVFQFGQALSNAPQGTPQERSMGKALMQLAGGIVVLMILDKLL